MEELYRYPKAVPRKYSLFVLYLFSLFWTIVFRNGHHFWVETMAWKFWVDTSTVNRVVIQYATFGGRWMFPSDNNKLPLVYNNTMGTATFFQFTKHFPFFGRILGRIESGYNIRGFMITNIATKNVEWLSKRNNRIAKNDWRSLANLMEYIDETMFYFRLKKLLNLITCRLLNALYYTV